MGSVTSLDELLRKTAPKTYHAENVVADSYLNQPPTQARQVR